MGRSQITDMDIVPNTRPVSRVVICPKDRHLCSTSIRHRQHEWDEMGLGSVAFTKLSLRVCSSRIEIAQADPAQPICRGARLQHALDKKLTLTIGVDGTERVLFCKQRVLWEPIDGTRRRKNQPLYPDAAHGL